MLNHNALAANIKFAIANMPIKPNDNILSFLPLAHVFGCLFDFLFPFSKGACIYMLNAIPSPNVLLKAFELEVETRFDTYGAFDNRKNLFKKIASRYKQTFNKKFIEIAFNIFNTQKKHKRKINKIFWRKFHELIIGGSALNQEVEKFLIDIGFKFTVGYGMTECAPLYKLRSLE